VPDTELAPPRPAEEGRPRLEVAEIFRAHGESYRRTHALSEPQRKAMSAIEKCRTAELGGHLDVCTGCGSQRPSYNSCRNRHCPKCQALRQAKWISERQARILPTHHFHVVFTVPAELHPLARAAPARFYDLLFESASETLLELGADPKRLGGQLAITAVLHTWTRDLRLHPHLHCVVSGGALERDGRRWRSARRGYLLPVKVLGALFRGKMMAKLDAAWQRGAFESSVIDERSFHFIKSAAYRKPWVVYAKTPFAGPAQVFAYLGRYTHRVAISNQRLLSVDERGVHFVTRGSKTATLEPEQFIGRFMQHVLPDGYVKIRHYGLLAASNVRGRLERARKLLEPVPANVAVWRRLAVALICVGSRDTIAAAITWRERVMVLTGKDPMSCARCGALLERLPMPSSAPEVLDSS